MLTKVLVLVVSTGYAISIAVALVVAPLLKHMICLWGVTLLFGTALFTVSFVNREF